MSSDYLEGVSDHSAGMCRASFWGMRDFGAHKVHLLKFVFLIKKFSNWGLRDSVSISRGLSL